MKSGDHKRSPDRSRKPKEIADLLESTLRAYRIDKKVEEYSGFPFWADAVGAEIARVAVPEKILRRKILVVRVLDAVWAQDLALRKPEILEKIASIMPGMLIEDIKFVTGNPMTVGERKKTR